MSCGNTPADMKGNVMNTVARAKANFYRLGWNAAYGYLAYDCSRKLASIVEFERAARERAKALNIPENVVDEYSRGFVAYCASH